MHIVVTSIFGPNDSMKTLAENASAKGHRFIVIGDAKSPADFHIEGCDYFNLDRQFKTDFKFVEICPQNNYCRKNIGYLAAMKAGAEIIVDTDDDNTPLEDFWNPRERQQEVPVLNGNGWTNVYRYFTDENIWPRGLALRHVRDGIPDFASLRTETVDCPMQQGLADGDPDVDSIYRLVLPLPLNFTHHRRVALGRDTWCPFNSQNTTYFKDAFPLLYMPYYCNLRMADIWRSFIAQRVAWENGWSILFHEPTVFQYRNDHDLLRDFSDELDGYLHNEKIGEEFTALNIQPGVDKLPENLILCYEKLIEMNLIDRKELDLISAFLTDMQAIQMQ